MLISEILQRGVERKDRFSELPDRGRSDRRKKGRKEKPVNAGRERERERERSLGGN